MCVCVFMQGECEEEGVKWSFSCCLCVFVNSCMFSWQALELAEQRALSASDASREQNGSFLERYDLHLSRVKSGDGGPRQVDGIKANQSAS